MNNQKIKKILKKILLGIRNDGFITPAISQIESLFKIAHITESGYCCACEYDIVGFQRELGEQREEIIKKIDKVYKKEKGIHHWLDLREKLKNHE